jgi:hypothetical protein
MGCAISSSDCVVSGLLNEGTRTGARAGHVNHNFNVLLTLTSSESLQGLVVFQIGGLLGICSCAQRSSLSPYVRERIRVVGTWVAHRELVSLDCLIPSPSLTRTLHTDSISLCLN